MTSDQSNSNDHDKKSPSRPSNSSKATQSTSRHHAFTGPKQTSTDQGLWDEDSKEHCMLSTGIPHQDQKLDLRGIGSQFQGYYNTDLGLDSYHNTTCSYHQPILDLRPRHERPICTDGWLSSYILGNPAEQYALYYRAETGCLSIAKGCTCAGIESTDRL